jgi:hypothetical protein
MRVRSHTRFVVAVAGVVGAFAFHNDASAQISLTPDRAPFLTADQLTATAGSDDAAAAILSQALAEYIRIFPSETTTVIGAQIPERWLPTHPELRYLRLTDEQARAHLQQCGRVLYVQSFSAITPERITITVAAGNRCNVSGLDFPFRRLELRWRLDTQGARGGFSSGMSHCGCG